MPAFPTPGWPLSLAQLLLSGWTGLVLGQSSPDTTFRTTYYEQKTTLHEQLPISGRALLFIGDSITDTAEWAELTGDRHALNRSISGDITYGLLARLGPVLAARPARVYLMMGINDLARGIPDSLIIRNYQRIAERFRQASPRTKLYWMSVLPTNGTFPQFARHQGKADHIRNLNNALKDIATRSGQRFVDLHLYVADPGGQLDGRFTNDGLHLNGSGYTQWVRALHENHCL